MMPEGYVVVLDAGTTRPRCVLFSRDGAVVAERATEWVYVPSEDGSTLAKEFDLGRMWSDFSNMIAACLQDAGVDSSQVAAVAVTSQRQSVVFMDAEGRELYAGPNTDLRAVFEGAAMDEEMGDRVYGTTGHTPSMLLAPAKLRWMRDHRREAYGRIATVLTLADWLVWKLTGVVANELTLAGESGLLDIADRGWWSALLSDLDLGYVPKQRLVRPGTIVGTVVDGESGLSEGIPVVAGGADTQCGLLGMGVLEPGQVGIVAGWSVPVQMVTAEPTFSTDVKTWVGCSHLDNRWVLESTAGDAGNSYEWLANTAFGGAPEAFAIMDSLASETPTGSDGTLALLGPARMDMNTLGMKQGGFLFPVPVAFGGTEQGHLARAALEGIAYAVKANLGQIEGVSGTIASSVSLGGGMTKTRSFPRILADVLGREVQTSTVPNVSALGAFACASAAIGDRPTLAEAAVFPMETVDPDQAAAAEYEEYYGRWLQASDHLSQIPL